MLTITEAVPLLLPQEGAVELIVADKFPLVETVTVFVLVHPEASLTVTV